VDVNRDGQIMLDVHILSCEVLGLTRATAAITLFCAIDQTDNSRRITHEEMMATLLNTFNETSRNKYFTGSLKE